jgi:sulfatase maturation enzyme AslB (radical SAM superfamily)
MNWLRLHVSNVCNFKCPNCHVFELGENIMPSRVMSQKVFNQSLSQFEKVMLDEKQTHATISLYGGETLANKKVIMAGIEAFSKISSSSLIYNWVINTNGSLLKREDIHFFKEHNVEIHISVDGQENIHNLSRPTHKGLGTFQMVVPALELIKNLSAPAQINTYMMPSNFEHLKDVVDIAFQYGINKIYLDQFYNLEMISHRAGLKRYREVYLYALSKDIVLSGPWEKVAKRALKNIDGKDEVKSSILVDVNVDGTFYFSNFVQTKKESRHIDQMVAFFNSPKRAEHVLEVDKFYEEKCSGCVIKNHCYGSAIDQVYYHIGEQADINVSCDFFRDWLDFVLKPIYFKSFETVDVISVLPIESIQPLLSKIFLEIKKLEEFLWPLSSKIILNVTEDHDEFMAAHRQSHLPKWVKAVTLDNGILFHCGKETTPRLIHELVHLFLSQRNCQIPGWFQEGICEWIQDENIKQVFLLESLRDKNLFSFYKIQNNPDVSFIELNEKIIDENPCYIQAKGFVKFIEGLLGKNKLHQLLMESSLTPFDILLKREGLANLNELFFEFSNEALDALRLKV